MWNEDGVDVDDPNYWSTNKCAEHGYEGIPPCPHPDCYRKGRDVYVTVKVSKNNATNADDDRYSVGAERIFIRQATHPKPNTIVHVWREVAYVTEAA